MTLWLRATLVAFTSTALACSSSTRHQDERDGDVDTDVEENHCPEEDACEAVGFGATFAIEGEGEVVNVDGDRIDLLGDDGQPLTFDLCGLSAEGLIAEGDRVRLSNRRAQGWGECWISELSSGSNLLTRALDCQGEGEVAPPVDELGWLIEFTTNCEGVLDQVCNAGGQPVHLRIPETLYDVEITVESGARELVRLGEEATLSPWRIHLVDARATEPVEEGRCFEPAAGKLRLTATRQPTRPPCPLPPEGVIHDPLGLDISASETIRELLVVDVTPREVILASEEGTEISFGWWGPDPRLAVPLGEMVQVRRYDQAVTGGGFLDVIEAYGHVALAVITRDDFTLSIPDLSVIDLAIALGEPCRFEDGVEECTGEQLFSERYPVQVTTASGVTAEVEVNDTAEVEGWMISLIEASQYPGVWCPDFHVEAWGPFALTAMQALSWED